MGYRSQVTIAIKKEEYFKNAEKLREAMKDCDTASENEHAFFFSWQSVKWYDSYEDIQTIQNVLNSLADADYGFLRIGEESNDIEERGAFYEYGIQVTSSITVPETKKLSETFFTLRSIEFIKEE